MMKAVFGRGGPMSVATAALMVAGLAGCQKGIQKDNRVLGAAQANAQSGPFVVLGQNTLKQELAQGVVLSTAQPAAQSWLKNTAVSRGLDATTEESEGLQGTEKTSLDRPLASLVVAYPVGLVGEQSLFGGVITQVSATQDENLGGLKLTDLSAIEGRTMIADAATDHPSLALYGCEKDCTEGSVRTQVLSIPILAVDQKAQTLILDLAALGDKLNLIEQVDPNGDYTQLKTKSSSTTSFDYTTSTLVFDVATNMIPKDAKPEDDKAPVTTFTVRWYLKLGSTTDPSFASRPATDGVGFFMTERSAEPKITRFAMGEFGQLPIHYYIKFVPKEFQSAFSDALDDWNDHFTKILGRKIISYDFIEKGDPRADLLVPGDIRYNIIEWDLVNKATYGGLGPSIANQFTGQTMSANVLIQGPAIIAIYTGWYKVSQEAEALKQQGRQAEAQSLLLAFRRDLEARGQALAAPRFALKLGKSLDFRVASQLPEFEDPLMQRPDFDDTPPTFDYAAYMHGYFHDMVAHEVGHNLGLRHNFRGNLGAAQVKVEGGVSRSVMEYLDRRNRYLDKVGEYDHMAITYGYTGKKPDHLDWYCTDEDVPDADHLTSSAECSRDDSTPDPFSDFESRLTRAIDFLTARADKDPTSAPTWTVSDMAREVGLGVTGLAIYAATGEETAAKWTNFATKQDRPKDPKLVKAYVTNQVKAQICDPSLADVVSKKATEDAKTKTQANLDALRAKITEIGAAFKVFTADDLKCAGGALDL